MSDARVDDLLRDLEGELSIEPSPQLVGRVRARIDDRLKRSHLATWTIGLAVTILVTALASGIEPEWRRQSPSIAPALLQVAAVGPVDVPPAVSGVPASVATGVGVSVSRRPANVRPASAGVEATAEVLVPPDQAIALRQILLAMRRGRSPVPPARAEAVDAEGRLPAPEGLGIPAITIQPITPLPDGGRNKDR